MTTLQKHVAYGLWMLVAILLIMPEGIADLAGASMLILLWLYERKKGGWTDG